MARSRKSKNKVRWLFWPVFLAVCGALVYAVYCGRLVTQRMSELKWDLPSRVYYAPINLFVGGKIQPNVLERSWARLGYRHIPKSGALQDGEWRRGEGVWEVRTRRHRDETEEKSPTTYRLTMEGDRIEAIEKSSGNESESVVTATMELERMTEIFGEKRQVRTLVRLRDTPPLLREAVLLTEDERFYSHYGLSLRSIARALFRNLLSGRVAEGGSTITQQLMKNFFLTQERTLYRKIREVIMTLVVERLYSKDEIFEAYLNELYMGQRGATSVHGMGEAASLYFGKAARDLTLSECALLAGLIRSPGRYSPTEHPDAARGRRDVVLEKLRLAKAITDFEYQTAKNLPLVARSVTSESVAAQHFVEYVKSEISKIRSGVSFDRDGIDIFTTLDANLQERASRAVKEELSVLDRDRMKRAKSGPVSRLEAALVAIDPRTGALKAMVGGRDWSLSQYNHATQARRPIGSTVKPLLAALALETPAISPATLLDDRPTTFSSGGRDWSPRNYENRYMGKVTLRRAIELSLNVATVNLVARAGVERVAERLGDFGFGEVKPLPSLALGVLEATPLQLSEAFSVVFNQGDRAKPFAVVAAVDAKGERIVQQSMSATHAMEATTAFQVLHILRGVFERGTARQATLTLKGMDVAGKTGTTQDYRDSWFVGAHPSLLTVVWVGTDDNVTTGLSGASGALRIWSRFMRAAGDLLSDDRFREPSGIKWYEVDLEKGCLGGGGEKIREAFVEGTGPSSCD